MIKNLYENDLGYMIGTFYSTVLGGYKNVLTKNDVQVLMQSEYIPLLLDALEHLLKYYIRESKASFLNDMELEPDFRITVGEYQSGIKSS